MSTLKVNTIQDTTGNDALTIDSSGNVTASQGFVPSTQLSHRNLIINGAMQVDQRNSGNSYAQINAAYNLDRFRGNSYDGGGATGKYTVQQSSTAPDDFSHSLLVTSSAATADAASNIFNIEQLIEGYNIAHLNFGTSSAKTITLSFYVRSSLTGTFGGALKNNGRNRAYPFSYTINSADTFERKEITISGDTLGTWIDSTNGMGLWVSFGLGVGSTYSGTAGAWGSGDIFSATGATSVVGTNGATWYITGVQLEVGSVATPFEHRSYGEELARCQRYYWNTLTTTSGTWNEVAHGHCFNTSTGEFLIKFPQKMRVPPTSSYIGSLSNFQVVKAGSVVTPTSIGYGEISEYTARPNFAGGYTYTAGQTVRLRVSSATANGLAYDSEL